MIMPGTASAHLKPLVTDCGDAFWTEIENQVIASFDGAIPIIDYWGLPIGREHVEKYFSCHRMRFRRLTDLVRRLIPVGGRVLEVGTAYGAVLLALKKLGYEVEGTDMAEGIEAYGIPLVRSGVSVKVWDIHRGPYPCSEGGYDAVIASEVLEHLQVSLKTAVGRLVGALRPRGWLVITTPNIYRLHNLIDMIKDRNMCEAFPDEAVFKENFVLDGRCHPREPTMKELIDAFQQNGLYDIESRYFEYTTRSARARLICTLCPRLREACLVLGQKA